jgi:periplasmic protein TonB
MRLTSYFVLSLALHSTVLVYPASFSARDHTEIMRVTIHMMEEEPPGGGAPAVSGNSQHRRLAPQARPKFFRGPTVGASLEAHRTPKDSEPAPEAAKPPLAMSEASSALASTTLNSAETESAAASAPSSSGGFGFAAVTAELGTGGDGEEFAGNGSGSASALGFSSNGGGAGDGQGGNGIVITQARYRETPRPNYPESARREGREGRVLLRVLVDDQGRSKRVEINSSSGSDVLDRAAAEAIRRWLFYPARYGDQPVESWLRIPIQFRLADAKS